MHHTRLMKRRSQLFIACRCNRNTSKGMKRTAPTNEPTNATCTGRTANPVVAELLAQSSQCIWPVFRDAVAGLRGPACSVLQGQARPIYDCADCSVRCWTQARPWPPNVRPERSKNQSAVRRALATAMHRVPRLAAVIGGLQQPRSDRLPIAVAVRSPPSEARASAGSRSRANQDVAFGWTRF